MEELKKVNLEKVYEEHRERLDNPDWKLEKYGFKPKMAHRWIHDWEKYVPDELKFQWNNLPLVTKAAIYLCCEPMANAEEWD